MAVEQRLKRLRDLAQERSYDAVVLRNNPDLRWLTGAERVFDFESAHTAFITHEGAQLHTDSRYYNSFLERLGDNTPWVFDQESIAHASWVIQQAKQAKAQTIALEDSIPVSFYQALKRAAEDSSLALNFTFLHGDLVKMRAVKDEEELEIMRAAQAITDAAFTHMCEFIQVGMTEKQVQAELDNFMYTQGADALSFESIVATGANSANPHAMPGQARIEKGSFVLMDYGAALRDYCSDMTRTVVMGQANEKQREIYSIVCEAHEHCSQAIKAGVSTKEVYKLAVKIISDAGYGDNFKHGLGHGVGIEIHELPNLGSGADHILEVGNVVTNEPGIYLPGFGGVRLEDYGVVTEEGFEVFTQSTHELIEL